MFFTSAILGTANSAAADGVGALKSATKSDIENAIRTLLVRYNAEYILLFGSYVRGEETPDSDVDVVVFVWCFGYAVENCFAELDVILCTPCVPRCVRPLLFLPPFSL